MASTPIIYGDMNLDVAMAIPRPEGTTLEPVFQEISVRVNSVRVEQTRFREWCDRADSLYYADTFTTGGADLWSTDPTATTDGMSHVSVNTPAVYVDVPAALQAVDPIEKMMATEADEAHRDAAFATSRVYEAWKFYESYELKFHKACTIKALYGRTAGKVYYDRKKGYPCVEVVEQPRNLYLGYKSDSYESLEWAAYIQRVEPNAVMEEFGVDVVSHTMDNGTIVPYIQVDTWGAHSMRPWLTFGPARVDVWDYWYRKPRKGATRDKKTGQIAMDTYNVVIAGNMIVRGPIKYPEYGGRIPYVPLFNTFLPGIPSGRAELFDMEPLIREKFERITSGSQMIAQGVAGDYWQMVGPEAPVRGQATEIKPMRNEVVFPGPGNRIESITPFIAEFQLEQFLGRLDREMAIVSGLNDLLLGLAPAGVLGSSKAVNALISNYELRLSMRRGLLYAWRKDIWELVTIVYAYKNPDFKAIMDAGGGRLMIEDPSLSPRDEMETATRAANLVNAKIFSQRRGMLTVGVDDPETEQDMIREERTDATIFPGDVMVMAQLMQALQTMNLNAPANVQGQAQAQLQSGQAGLAQALGAATPDNTTGTQTEDTQGQTPEMPGLGQTQGGQQPPFAQAKGAPNAPAQPGRPGGPPLLQTRIGLNGQLSPGGSHIQTQAALGRR